MPGMDGKEFLKKFKATKEGKEVPVLMVTSVEEVESMIECFKEGANDYITKPLINSPREKFYFRMRNLSMTNILYRVTDLYPRYQD